MKSLLVIAVLAMAASAAAQPVVLYRPKPLPNAEGWNNSSVLMEYGCVGAMSCPDDTEHKTEGAGQTFTATARDANGVETTLSHELNIDLTAPAVVIESPRQGAVTTNALITVVAQVTDALSGVASATCNGMPAGLSPAGRIQCIVLAVPGLNDIVVEAFDRAHNSGSAGVRVLLQGAPQTLRVVPDVAGMLLGSTRTFQVLDEFGLNVPDVMWSVDAPERAQIFNDGRHALTARAPGQVILTANYRGLSAKTTVTIFTGDRLPPNAIRWKVDGLRVVQTPDTKPPLASEGHMVTTHQQPGGLAHVQSTEWASGRLNWRMRPAVRTGDLIASVREHPDGGAVMVVNGPGQYGSALVRGGDLKKGAPWRYRSAGKIAPELVLHTDSSISFLEMFPDGSGGFVSISGDRGVVLGRMQLPIGIRMSLSENCVPGANTVISIPGQVGPINNANNQVMFPVVVTEDREDYAVCGSVSGRMLRTVYVAVLGSGLPRVEHLRDYTQPAGAPQPSFNLYPVSPDGHGGVLIPWTAIIPGANERESRVVRLSEQGRQEFLLPAAGKIWLSGKEDDAVMTDGNRLVVFNVLTGEVRWNNFYPTGVKIISVQNGQMILESADKLGAYDSDGRPIPKPPQ